MYQLKEVWHYLHGPPSFGGLMIDWDSSLQGRFVSTAYNYNMFQWKPVVMQSDCWTVRSCVHVQQ